MKELYERLKNPSILKKPNIGKLYMIIIKKIDRYRSF